METERSILDWTCVLVNRATTLYLKRKTLRIGLLCKYSHKASLAFTDRYSLTGEDLLDR